MEIISPMNEEVAIIALSKFIWSQMKLYLTKSECVTNKPEIISLLDKTQTDNADIACSNINKDKVFTYE